MSTSVLVAFATIHGSTQEVAEAAAEVLRERGFETDVQLARNVKALGKYGAVILGAPLYMFRWHQDALNFLSRHHKALIERPVAVFALGPFNNDEKEFQGASEQLEKELAKFPWFKPVSRNVFGGKYDPTKRRFPYNLIPGLNQIPASDIRDWAAIRTWTGELALGS